MTQYKMVSTTNDMALRVSDSTSATRITGITNNPKVTTTGYILRNTEMLGDLLTTPRTGEQWLKVHTVNGIKLAVAGYVAYKIGTVTYCTLTEIIVPVPPSDITITSVWVKPVYSDGTIGVEEEYIPKV